MSLADTSLTPDQIEYKVSAPAIHAARSLALNFDIIERTGGEVPYCDHNVAVLIDVHTQAWRIKKAMREVFTSGDFYYPDVNSLEANLEALQYHIEQINELRNRLPQFDGGERLHSRLGIENRTTPGTVRDAEAIKVSAAALNAVRQLQIHFIFVPKESGIVPATEKGMAELIDLCTEVRRLESGMNLLCTQTRWQSRDELRRNLQVVKQCLHAVDVAQMRMPSYSREMGKPLWRSSSVSAPDPAQNDARRRRAEQVQAALRQAKNPEQAARILREFSGG
jgi:hypothetical protein